MNMRSSVSAIALAAVGLLAITHPASADYQNKKWCERQGLDWQNDQAGCLQTDDQASDVARQGGTNDGITPRPSPLTRANTFAEMPAPLPRPLPPDPNKVAPTRIEPPRCGATSTPEEMRSFCTQAFQEGNIDPRNAGACAGWLSVLTTGIMPSTSGNCEPPAATGKCRRVFDWPCSADSPWNTPIGSGAKFAGASDPRVSSLRKHGRASFNTSDWSIAVGHAGQNVSIPGGRDQEIATIASDGSVIETFHAGSSDPYVRQYDAKGSCISSQVGHQLGIRAGGQAAIAGLVRNWEVQPGAQIQHALAISVCRDQLRQGPVWPATMQDNFSSEYSGSIPMGTLFAIPPSTNLAGLGLSSAGQKVAEAAQKYGAYVVDQGCGPAFYGEPSMDRSAASQISGDISKIAMSMEVVTNNSSATPGGGGQPLAPRAPEFCQGE